MLESPMTVIDKKIRVYLKTIYALIILLISPLSDAYAWDPIFLSGQKRAEVSISVKDASGKDIAQGTGFIVDREGIVATSCRMISIWLDDVGYDLIVRTGEGDTFSLYRLLGCNKKFDIAVFKLDADGFAAVRLLSGNNIAEYIKSQINRYKRIVKVKPPKKEPQPEVVYKMPDLEERAVEAALPAEEIIVKSLDTSDSHYLRGLEYARLRKYTEAVEEYKEALKLKSDHIDAHMNLGLAYYKLERYTDAIGSYNQALKIKPYSKVICNKIGTMYLIAGEYSEALKAFKKALSIDGKDPATHFNLAITDVLKGDRDSAWLKYMVLKSLDAELASRLLELIN